MKYLAWHQKKRNERSLEVSQPREKHEPYVDMVQTSIWKYWEHSLRTTAASSYTGFMKEFDFFDWISNWRSGSTICPTGTKYK